MDKRLARAMLWPVVCLACVSLSRAQDDVDDLLASVYGKPSTEVRDQDNSVSCTCLPYHSCKQNSTHTTPENTSQNPVESTTHTTTENTSQNPVENEYGEHLIDIRIDPDPDAECEHYLDKCCFPADQSPTPNPSPTPPPPPLPPPEPHPVPVDNACGIRNSNGAGFRITGGKDHEANYGEFPWMVAVMRRDHVIDDVILKVMECGGSIIHPQVVLTGAHCVKGKHDLYIRAGEWDTQTEKEFYPTQDRDVKQVIMHEGYYAGGLHNDVALLVLDKALDLGPVVGTLCLPEQGEVMDGKNCVVSGWGKDEFGKKGKYQAILKRVEKPVLPREPCQEELRKTRLGARFRLHESFICAGGQVGKDTCKGDGGSALACPTKDNPNVYVQAGIVAWGIGCGTATPSVYVNVPHFRKWIDEKLDSLQFS